MKKRIMGLGIMLAAVLILYCGYDAYSHYMVKQLYKYIDDGNTDKAIECIEKMPNVNMLEMCLWQYCVAKVFTEGASMTGYPLYYAISHKADISIIRALLEKGADPNRTDLGLDAHYPLRYVCMNPSKNMYEKILLLIEHGADINMGYLYMPSQFAVWSEETQKSMFLSIVYFWENGAEEWRYVDSKHVCTVLHEAAECMDVEHLQELYNNTNRTMEDLLNAKDANGETPLFRAIRAGMFDNCIFLIKEGTDISIRNNEQKTAYDVAVELGYEDKIEGLKQ